MVGREQFVGLKLTQDEYSCIVKKAQEDRSTCWKSGKENLSAYIRKCVLSASGYEKEIRIKKEVDALTYQVRKIGVNINQAVKRINADFYSIETTEALQESLDKVNRSLTELIDRLEEIDGSNKTDEY